MTSGRRFIVCGAGGHGRVVADLVLSIGDEVVGFVDREATHSTLPALPVVDEREFLEQLGRSQRLPLGANSLALGIGDNHARMDLIRRLENLSLPVLLHPTAAVSRSASVGAATVVMALAAVNAGANVGRGVVINTGAVVEHDCRIDDGAHISPGAILAGGVRVGRETWIGAGAVIIPNVRIGDGCIVGAGAVVLHDTQKGETVVGVPAHPVVHA